jgi:hypothetical protein
MRMPTGLPDNIRWNAEAASDREQRRDKLCTLDGILVQLEEKSLIGRGQAPAPLSTYRRFCQVAGISPQAEPPAVLDLLEATLAIQEAYMIPIRARRSTRPTQPPKPPLGLVLLP